jgi:hypothetical protein
VDKENKRIRAELRKAIDEVLEERAFQDKKWGRSHDVEHTPEDWVAILTVYLGKVAYETPLYQHGPPRKEILRKRLCQVAAIAIAAMEATGE